MSLSAHPSPRLKPGNSTKVFTTIEAFNEGYAGPDTKSIEKKSRDLAGRQDEFCIICGSFAEELFPQTGPKEIHLCPRQLCRSCWHIEAGWKRDSPTKRRSLKGDGGSDFVPVCCPLCWKRGWDFVSPLHGADQPEWQINGPHLSQIDKAEIMSLRHKNWERGAVSEVFSWRKPLLTRKDDMSIESDRELLRSMLKKFQKSPKRFSLFDPKNAIEATSRKSMFEVADAFRAHCISLQNAQSINISDEEVVEEAPVKRGPGRPRKRKNRPSWYIIEEPIEPATYTSKLTADLAEKSVTPDSGGRPKRQAARLSFASGFPVQNQTIIDDNDDVVEAEAQKETPATRSLKARSRKIVVFPVSLPASPSDPKKDNFQPSPAFSLRGGVAVSGIERLSASDSPVEIHAATKNVAQSTIANGPLPNGTETEVQDQVAVQDVLSTPITQTSQEINGGAAQPVRNDVARASPSDLEAEYTALQAEYSSLESKYRRWRTSVIDNAKLLVDQEADVEAKKDIITACNKNINQLSMDNARLGAELALARGMVQYNPALLKQSFLRGTLSPDVVERLFQNPDFVQLMQPRPADAILPPPPHPSAQDPGSARPKKRRRTTAAVLSDPDAEEARQKKLSRVIAPTMKRLEKSRFKLSATMIASLFDADTAESKRFLDSLIDFAKLPTITFDEAYALINEAQQDRRQGRVIVPQLRLSDPTWAPWDVKTAQKRYMQRNGMAENEAGEIVAVTKNPKSMEEMVADAKAVRDAAAKRRSTVEVPDDTIMSTEDGGGIDDLAAATTTDEARIHSSSSARRNGRSDSEFRRVWERHEELRRERELREQEEQRAAMPPLDLTDPLQALAASMFTSVNGPAGSGRAKGRHSNVNGRRRHGSPRAYQRREAREHDDDDESMELSDSS